MNVTKVYSRANRVGRSLEEHSRAPHLRGTASRERSGALEHQPVPENALNVPHECKWASTFNSRCIGDHLNVVWVITVKPC